MLTEGIDYEDFDGQWRHIALTKSGATLTYYLNGEMVSSSTLDAADIMTDAMPFFIGGQPGNPTNTEFFSGSVDDVRIYDNSLTAAEVLALVGEVLQPPLWDSRPLITDDNEVDTAITGTLASVVTNPLSGTLTFAKVSGPGWLTIASDGTLSGTPTATDIGPNQFEVTATNADGIVNNTVIIRVVDSNAPEISAQLLGWWPLNDGSGDAAIDISGNGSDAIITNATTGGRGTDGSVWLDDPDCGTVLSFNGDNATGAYAFATTLPTFTLDPSSGFTWSLWAKPAQAANSDIIVGNRWDATGVSFTPRQFIKLIGNGFQWDTNNVQSIPFTSMQPNVWAHHSIVKDGATLTYYRNGIELGTQTLTAAPSQPQPFFLAGQNTGERWNGALFDVRLYNEALTPLEVFTVSNRKGLFAPIPSDAPVLSVAQVGSNLTFTWDSITGKLYNLRSDTTLGTTAPGEWPIVGTNMGLAATPPQNSVTLPRPSDGKRFYVVEAFDAPPVAILSDNFENGVGSWVTGSNGAATPTLWQLGAPSNVGPSAAKSGSNCFATNIAANYAPNASIWLRSPAIDLTAVSSATLNFSYFLRAEPTFDFGFVRVLDAADDTLIAQIGAPLDATTADWTAESRALPAGAFGKIVKIEFLFQSDDIQDIPAPGWYLDDVVVTIP